MNVDEDDGKVINKVIKLNCWVKAWSVCVCNNDCIYFKIDANIGTMINNTGCISFLSVSFHEIAKVYF